jgi:hypothetical protein
MEAKYRKYGGYMSKQYRFGDFLDELQLAYGGDFLQGALSGASTGASVGTAFGPWGTAIGAIGGGLIGGFSNAEKQKNLEKGMIPFQQSEELIDPYSTSYSGINIDGSMKMGGRLRKKYAAGGSLTSYNSGGQHSENPLGGIPVGSGASTEEGETLDNDKSYVFSDRIVIDKDMANEFSFPKRSIGKSLAAYSKTIEKDNPRDHDSFDKNSRRRMLDRVIEANESFNMKTMEDDYDNLLKKKMGGKLYKMYKGGQLARDGYSNPFQFNVEDGEDTLTPPTGYDEFGSPIGDFSTYGQNPQNPFVANNTDYSELRPLNNYDPTNPIGSLPQKTDIQPFYTPPSTRTRKSTAVVAPVLTEEEQNRLRESDAQEFRSTTDINQSPLLDAARLVPIAANLLAGSKHDTLDKNDYRVKSRIKPGRYNINPLLDQNKSDFVQTQGQMRESAGGSGGTYLANLQALFAGKTKANTQAYATKENAETQMDIQAQMANADIEGRNRQQDFSVDDWNARSKAAAKNLQMTAAGQVGEYADAKVNEAFMEAYLNSLSDRYKYNFTRNFRDKNG